MINNNATEFSKTGDFLMFENTLCFSPDMISSINWNCLSFEVRGVGENNTDSSLIDVVPCLAKPPNLSWLWLSLLVGLWMVEKRSILI